MEKARRERLKILHIIDSAGYYGAEVMLTELCLAQRTNGIDAQVLSIGSPGHYEKPLETHLKERGIPVHTWRTGRSPNFLGAIGWGRWAAGNGFDVLHSHGYKGNILFGFLGPGLRRLPLVSTLHGWTTQSGFNRLRIYEWLDALVLRYVSTVVLVNPLMESRPEIAAIRRAKVKVVVNGLGVSASNSDPDIIEKLFEFKGKGRLLGAVGRLSKEKGFDILLHSLRELLDQGVASRLVILGEGSERPALERLIDKLDLQHDVWMPGYVENASAYASHFDLLVNSSLTEGLPITLLEAMRVACPIVATALPTVCYLTNNGALAELAEPGSSVSLAEALLKALENQTELKNKSFKAQQCFLSNYTAEAMERNYRQIYEQCVTE